MGKNEPKEITKKLWDTLKKLGRRRISPKVQANDLLIYFNLDKERFKLEMEFLLTTNLPMLTCNQVINKIQFK